MIKKCLCLLMALLVTVSCLPTVMGSTEIVIENEIQLTDAATIRNGSAHRDTVQTPTMFVVDYSGNSRRFTYVKFDLAPYINDIENITEIKFSLVPQTATEASDFTLEILPDSMEDWSSSTLTYSLAESAGMTVASTADDPVDFLCTTNELTNGERKYTVDIADAVKEHLTNNPSNTIVSFKLHTSNGNVYVIRGLESGLEPTLAIKVTMDINQLLQTNYDNLTFDKISDETEDAVTSNLNLVTEGTYGTTITWSSSDEEAINPRTGIIRRPMRGEGEKEVRLEAFIENTGYSLPKVFNVILPESNIYTDDLVLQEFCYAADSTFVRRGSAYIDNVVNTGDIVIDPKNMDRMGFVKFNFSACEEYLNKANSMQLRVDTKGDANVANHSNLVIYVLPEEYEDIDTSTLTYNMAKSKGLIDYTDNMVFVQSDVAKNTTYRSGDILPAIKKNIEEGDDKVVWLKFASTEGVGYTINGSVAGEALKPALIIKYPKPATELDFYTLTIPEIVNSDIELPSIGEFGSEVTWSSGKEETISYQGSVNVGTADEDYTKEDEIVTLTATISAEGTSIPKQFPVRIKRNGVIDAKEDATFTPEETVVDATTISSGGTAGRIALIKFDVDEDLSAIQDSRKTVLKLYGNDAYEDKLLTVVPVTDADICAEDFENISYDDLETIIDADNAFKSEKGFEEGGYVIFDITEYMYSLENGNAMFAICSDDPQIIMESLEGELGKEPKLVVSPTAYTDLYAAETVAGELELTDLTDEDPSSIRNNITLPINGRFGSTITWASSSQVIDPTDGTVNRGETNTRVTLTATITVNSTSVTKEFELNVRKAETNMEYAAFLASDLEPDFDILTSSISLKGADLPDGAVASWESSEPYEAKVEGFNLEITRPKSADLPVVLTVSVTYGGATAKHNYNVTVVRSSSKNLLHNRKITEGEDSAQLAIDEDIATAWNISNPSLTIDLGMAKVVSGMTIVPEQASFSGLTISVSDDMYQWKIVHTGGTFAKDTLNYIAINPIAYGRYLKLDFPDSAKAISFIGAYNTSDDSNTDVFDGLEVPNRATSDFELAESLYGSPITWESSSTAIKIDGYTADVKRGDSGKNVTLIATIVINGETHTKFFVVYVPAEDGSGGGGSGGGSSFGGSFIPVPSVVPQTSVVTSNSRFADLGQASWATEYITYLADKGIVNGKGEGNFAPLDNLKREEIAKIIVLGFGLYQGTSANTFGDVADDAWYVPYVTALYENGITKGMGDGNFGIGVDITRQDAFTMIASVLGLDTSADASISSGFGDDSDIAEYARGSVNALKKLGIVSGDDKGNVNPTSKITRAEIAKVICLAIGNK